jgi:hypothetical protein
MQNVKRQYGCHLVVISFKVKPIMYLQPKAINNSDSSEIRSYGRPVIRAQHANHELNCSLQLEYNFTLPYIYITRFIRTEVRTLGKYPWWVLLGPSCFRMDFYNSEASYSLPVFRCCLTIWKQAWYQKNGRSDYNHFITFTKSARHLKWAIMESDRGLFI